jgi:hypothetical protein
MSIYFHNRLTTNAARALRCGLWGRLAMTLLLLAGIGTSLAEKTESLSEAETVEYQLKAGFLFNFAKFVQWPGTISAGTNAVQTNEFRIGVLDASDAYLVVSNAIDGKHANDRNFVVERVETPTAAAGCNLLFVTRKPTTQAKAILAHVSVKPVLTVGETPGFAADGGCINFVRHAQKVRFEINLEAATKAGLKVSSHLSTMAIMVKTKRASE